MTRLLTGANHHVQYQAKQLPVPEVRTAHPHQHWRMQRWAKKRDKDSKIFQVNKCLDWRTNWIHWSDSWTDITCYYRYTPPFLSANTLMILPIFVDWATGKMASKLCCQIWSSTSLITGFTNLSKAVSCCFLMFMVFLWCFSRLAKGPPQTSPKDHELMWMAML